MPRIIVIAECERLPAQRIVLEERLVTAHLDSDHASAQLVERLAWALVDADELESVLARGGSSAAPPDRPRQPERARA